jgi:uncharacterized protein YkwD
MCMGSWRGLALVVAAACALAAPASASRTAPAVGSAALEQAVLAEVNAVRTSNGLPPVRWSQSLASAARAHSAVMAQRGFFSHSSRDGSAFWKRVQRYYGSRGYRYWSVGENLLWSSPDVDAKAALQMWLNSPPHRKTLLSKEWREIGLGAVHVPSAPGTYGGREVTIVTADFGVRR